MDLSIIIVNWNTEELLRNCLRSVYGTIDGLAFEVIVVDNASTDGSAEMVSRNFPAVTLLARQDNLGFAGGNNLALRSLGFEDKPHPSTAGVAQRRTPAQDEMQQSTLSGGRPAVWADRSRRGGRVRRHPSTGLTS